MKTAVTISLVEEAAGGPFVYWDGLADGCRRASAAGFDAVELFVPGPDAIDRVELRNLLDEFDLSLAAVGTGAGWVKHGLSLTDVDPAVRSRAVDFIRSIIALAGDFDAPAIIGSMQGKCAPGMQRDQAIGYLGEALADLAGRAKDRGQVLLYEPLNRYETNLFNTIASASDFIAGIESESIKLLADLFHMNIEEADVPKAIREHASRIGHVHFVDSNRWAAGFGHLDLAGVMSALQEIGYCGYLCAEAFPLPDADAAAAMTIQTIRNLRQPQ